MMRVLSRWLLIVLLWSSGVAVAAPFSAHFVFGDSLSDSGNLFLATGGALPKPGDYWNGHFSDGPTYIEVVSQQLGLPLAPSLAGGTNYAVGGALTGAHVLNTPAANAAFSLQGQLSSYFAAHDAADASALYTVYIGSNDIFAVLELVAAGQPLAAQALFKSAIAGTSAALKQLVDAGAQNLLLPTITDLGLTPRLTGAGPAAQALASALAADFNQAIDFAIAQIALSSPDVNIVRPDTYALLQQVVANPASFGLDELKPCSDGSITVPSQTICPDPETHVFWDDIHPSAATHKILAQHVLVALVPAPGTLLLVSAGVLLLGLRRRAGADREAR